MGAAIITLASENFSPIDGFAGFQVTGTLTLSASYATGGDTVTPQQLGGQELKFMNIEVGAQPGNSAAGGIVYKYDSASGKIVAFWQNPPAIAAGPLTEVANGTNLTAFVAPFQANVL